MLVTLLTSQLFKDPANAIASLNRPDIFVILLTSQLEILLLNALAPLNIAFIFCTLDKSGASVKFPVKFVQPLKAFSIVVHVLVPHCSIVWIFSLSPELLK